MSVFANSVKYCRIFKYEVIQGQEANYQHYLDTVVNPIDKMAESNQVFHGVVSLLISDNQQKRYQCRMFSFISQAQRDAFANEILAAALRFDGSTEATQQRKAYAETLRRLVSVEDIELV